MLGQTWASDAINPDWLRSVIADVVRETVANLDANRQTLDERCYSEPEAATWLGVAPHVLRDERLRGRITASRIVGSRIRYMRADLLDYVASRRLAGGTA